MPYLPKFMVGYEKAKKDATEKCGNCVMFQEPNRCTLVMGNIDKQDVCDRWEAKPDAVR